MRSAQCQRCKSNACGKVNSHQLPDVSSPPDSEWPYSASVSPAYSSTMPRITSDPSQYALANGNMLPPSTTTPYLGQLSSGRPQSIHDISNSLYPAASSRQALSPGYYGSLETPPFQQYDLQVPRQVYPLQMSQMTISSYTPDPSNSWVPLSTADRPQYSNLTFNQDGSAGYTPPAFPYLGTATNPGISEKPSTFPGLSPLVTHLPASGVNRILPHPTLRSSVDGGIGGMQDTDGDGGMSLFQQHLDKNGDSWDLGRITTRTSQGSVNSSGQNTICVSASASSTSSSSPGGSQELAGFGYSSMTQPSPIESSSSSAGYHSGDASTALHLERPSYPTTSTGHLGRQGGIQLQSINAFSNYHGLSARASNSGPRILQPQPRHSPSYDLLRSPYETSQAPRAKVLKSNASSQQTRSRR